MSCACCRVQTECCADPIRRTMYITVDDQPSVAMVWNGSTTAPCWSATVSGCTFPCYVLCCVSGAWNLSANDCGTPFPIECTIVNGEIAIDCGPPFSFTLTCVTFTCCGGSCSIIITEAA